MCFPHVFDQGQAAEAAPKEHITCQLCAASNNAPTPNQETVDDRVGPLSLCAAAGETTWSRWATCWSTSGRAASPGKGSR